MKFGLPESSIVFLLIAQTLLVSGVWAKSPLAQVSNRADIPLFHSTGTFILKGGSDRSEQVSISETSYFTYHVTSNTSVSVVLARIAQPQQANESAGLKDAIYEQNGSTVRNAALLTLGEYYLAFHASRSSAEINYSYVISAAMTRNATTYFGETLLLQPKQTYSIHLNYETLGAPSTLALFGISNLSVYYSIYDESSNSVLFRSPLLTVTNSSDNNIVKDSYTMGLSRGMYTLHVTNPHTARCLLRVEYRLSPSYANPYLALIGRELTGYPKSLATGLSSFGLYNQSGQITPYEIKTNEVAGFANISSISAYNPKPPIGVEPASASLQLNAVLVVKNLDESSHVYWVQNVFAFQTDTHKVHVVVVVVNITGLGAYLDNRTIQGRGGTMASLANGSLGNYYSSEGPAVSYDFPLAFSVSLKETLRPNQDVWVSAQTSEFQSGRDTMNANTTTDDVLIKDRNASEAYFLISGRDYAPQTSSMFRDQPGLLYDAEFVFGGGASGEVTTFKALGANLRLIFFNQTVQGFQLFPSYHGFGTDTLEATDNQKVTFDGQFAAMVSGVPDHAYLGRSSHIPQSILPPEVVGNAGRSPLPALSIAAGVAVIALLMTGVLVVQRRRKKIGIQKTK